MIVLETIVRVYGLMAGGASLLEARRVAVVDVAGMLAGMFTLAPALRPLWRPAASGEYEASST